MEDEDDEKMRAAVTDWERRLNVGEPMMTFALSTPAKLQVVDNVVVLDAATNMASPGGIVNVMRLLIPGDLALQLRDYLNAMGFSGGDQQTAKH